MSRRWLVVAVLCLAGDAVADPPPIAPLACECPGSYILPARGTAVPANANVWLFGATSARGELDLGATTVKTVGSLQANVARVPITRDAHAFHAEGFSTTFTVGSEIDRVAPAPPTIRALSIVVHPTSSPRDLGLALVANLDLDATFANDADLVHIVLREPNLASGGAYTSDVYTIPGRVHLCDPPLHIPAGAATATITAVDLAGNESAPVVVPVTVTQLHDYVYHCTGRAYRPGYSYRRRSFGPKSDLTSLGFVLVIMAGIGLLAARAVRADGQARANARAPVEQVSLLVAEPLARRARRMRVLEIGAYAGLIVAGWTAGFYAVAILAVFVVLALDGVLEAGRVLKLLDDPQAGAELRGTQLTACAHGTHASIRVPSRAIARAKQQAVPKTVVV